VDEAPLKYYFLEQVGALVARSTQEPEGFSSYFSDREPRDEEILALIAVSTMLSGKHRISESFPAPAEALAALSPEARAEICHAFRKALRTARQEPLISAA
jgi:hypothetical protein